jgi:hypothetical protein
MHIVVRLLIAWSLLSVVFYGPFIVAPLIRMALRRLGLPAARQAEEPTRVVRERYYP